MSLTCCGLAPQNVAVGFPVEVLQESPRGWPVGWEPCPGLHPVSGWMAPAAVAASLSFYPVLAVGRHVSQHFRSPFSKYR